MGQIDYPEKGRWEKPASRCNWCGNPEVKILWSGRKGQYCSFRCNAGGFYPRSVLVAILMSGLTTIMVLLFATMQASNPNTPIPSFFGLMLAVPVIISSQFIYAAYVGRLLVKERQSESIQSGYN
jgi:hypothetical protein